MAGLLAWAADVVGGGGGGGANHDDEQITSIPIIFTPEQQNYVRELNQKAASLSRSVRDLRLRLPPPDISQRLPHLHAHSLASTADLTLQLNAHSSTREQVQLRVISLQEENVAYGKAISNCENKIQEKRQEADLLMSKLEELEETTKNLEIELEKAQAALENDESINFGELTSKPSKVEAEQDMEVSKSALLEKLDIKKQELSSMEDTVKELEKRWVEIQDKSLKQPSPVQREKMLDKQLHSLIEQLAVKQAQAEGLASDIHLKEMELEKLNASLRRLQSSSSEAKIARNRFGRSMSDKNFSDHLSDSHHRLPCRTGGRSENQQRLMLLRSAFVLYILALHIVVFIKISF
ncbi:golgin subfamily A member 1 [Benincasa hispida]|uniref:golgin subfamily A member 1 n=1 Tax=Benincasa hispida TaxID=102211 RepID=UPI001901C759|nr:golgin subfamily A member 1 [Benincasa hispida]